MSNEEGKRQLCMVIDLNKCIGCHTCTIACKLQWTNRNGRDYMYWNNVETHPGEGYPRDWQTLGGGFDANGVVQFSPLPKIEVYRRAVAPQPIYDPAAANADDWVAIVTDDYGFESDRRILRFNDTMWLQLLANLAWEHALVIET